MFDCAISSLFFFRSDIVAFTWELYEVNVLHNYDHIIQDTWRLILGEAVASSKDSLRFPFKYSWKV